MNEPRARKIQKISLSASDISQNYTTLYDLNDDVFELILEYTPSDCFPNITLTSRYLHQYYKTHNKIHTHAHALYNKWFNIKDNSQEKFLAFLENVAFHIVDRKHNMLFDWVFPIKTIKKEDKKDRANKLEPLIKKIACRAARRGKLEMIKGIAQKLRTEDNIINDQTVILGPDLCSAAAEGGQLDVLIWAITYGCEWSSDICTRAAENGHLSALQWLRNNGCPWTSDVTLRAATNGHLTVLQYARKNNCRWNKDVCSFAAEHGHFEILQWARLNGCPWDSSVTYYASLGGHLEILQWARENNCEFDPCVCYSVATRMGHVHVAQWIKDSGYIPALPDSCM